MLRFAFLPAVFAAHEVVEVSLASPAKPHPRVAAAISAAEARREANEARYVKRLAQSYDSILGQASTQLTSALAGRKSFLGANIADPVIELNVIQGKSDDGAGASAVDALEAKRASAEEAKINSAISELSELAKVIVSAYSKAAQARAASFLAVGNFAREINVKLMSDPSFATIANMGAEMEKRRDVAEDALRARILDLQIRLAKSLNAVARAAVKMA